jgi:hypothetical protein
MLTCNDETVIESFNSKLLAIESSMDKIQKAILKKIVLTNHELAKELVNCKNKMILVERKLLQEIMDGAVSSEIKLITEKIVTYKNIINDLSTSVCKITLPDEMEQICILNDSLNERMRNICKQTDNISPEPQADTSVKYDSETVKNNFLHLYSAHEEGNKLLKHMQFNLHVEWDENGKPKLN